MPIDISETHREDYEIHEKCPEPYRTRMDSHTIECHCKSIETYRDEKHPRTRIGDECSDWFYEGRMPFLYCEEIRAPDREHDTEESPEIHSLMEEKHTRKHGRNRDESLHRSYE